MGDIKHEFREIICGRYQATQFYETPKREKKEKNKKKRTTKNLVGKSYVLENQQILVGKFLY